MTRKRPDAAALMADMAPTAATLDAIDKAPRPAEAVELVPLERIKASPYQPSSRPSSDAIGRVEAAIAATGSLSALLEQPDERLTELLGPREGAAGEARQLAELAFDIQTAASEGRGIGGSGIDTALEARTVQADPVGRTVELLSGHRRTAAARLAGSPSVPVLNRGSMTEDEAATAVVRRNLHRADLTPWQEARILGEVAARRRESGQPHGVKDLARLMGYSIGRVSTLQKIGRTFAPMLPEIGNGDPGTAEARLARLGYNQLEAVARIDDDSARLLQIRAVTGLSAPPAPSKAPDVSVDPSGSEAVKTPPSASDPEPARKSAPKSAATFDRIRGGGLRLTADDYTLQIFQSRTPEQLRALAQEIATSLRREASKLEKDGKARG